MNNEQLSNPALAPLTFLPLALGSIRPKGWLRNQLQIQAGGLSGHLDEFWPDVAESGWIGGAAEGWERGPYWLDGVVPLAFLLDDARLKGKTHRWMDYVLDHQQSDGWLGPVRDPSGKYQPRDPWPVFVMLKAMTQYQEATGDERIIPALERFLHTLGGLLDEKPLFKWGRFRWADLVLSVHWLFDRTQEPWLLRLAAKVHAQGYDWRHHFDSFRYWDKGQREDCDQTTHVVNNAMAIKQPGVWFRQSLDERDRDAAFQIMETLDRYQGQATGLFTGDEHLAGKNPSQGTELCAVVEYMFSLETLESILGDPRLGDRLERIAFNGLPATFKPDMWAHQYDQQANQVVCRVAEDQIYGSNGPDSNIFGLEPNYGCCTANMHQGWPKFASHLWMATPDGGLVAATYAPSAVVADLAGERVQVDLETDYPFDETLRFTVRADRSATFPLRLRIPGWAEGATVDVGDDGPIPVMAGTFYCIGREWSGDTAVTVRLPMHVGIQRRYHSSVSIERGPLVYALKIGEDWRQIGGELPYGDWEVYPTAPWNYALQMGTVRLEESVKFETRLTGDCPFSPEGAPVVAKVMGKRLPEWALERDAAGTLPESPVRSDEPLEELELIPYGCTNLRVTEFPVLG